VGQRDEAEMGCGSGSLGAAARLGSRFIARAAVRAVVSGHGFSRAVEAEFDKARPKKRRNDGGDRNALRYG
jgi:hypothetical protein